jgi:hypothetical protein
VKIEEEVTVEFDISKLICYCHLFWGKPKSLCGVPRAEQKLHQASWGYSIPGKPVCPDCGLKACPRCESVNPGKFP